MKKTAIITAAANGIGKAVATLYASKGFQTVLTDIDSENGEKLRWRLRG
ncbi:SDR family NAD(P)-dependent oxidoreductase [Rhodohalobacter sp. SW132]|nr:SDR family NAD(P)-dependent oxidoreductase [Rhodohalobacter sp. SW132]REL33439.1 SDR family NAD(P)-dependent oxidoreductase [Rhodohalobacter sp. SW132]